MTILENIKQTLKELEEKKQAAMELIKRDFSEILKPIFEKSKKITSFTWTQYSPYFNDSDECTFSVNIDRDWGTSINGERIDELDEENDFLSETLGWGKDERPNPNYDKNESNVLDELISVISSIPEEFMEELFGNHVEVTVYADGTNKTEEYEHD